MHVADCQAYESGSCGRGYPEFRQIRETARPVVDFVDGIMFAQERVGNPSLASLPLQFSA